MFYYTIISNGIRYTCNSTTDLPIQYVYVWAWNGWNSAMDGDK